MDTLHKLMQQVQTLLSSNESASRLSAYSRFLSDIKNNKVTTDQTPDFSKGLLWINTTEPLSLYGNLKGKVVVLDFWTYCCVNCLHILPDLHEIEQRFPVADGVVVVGVHCAKFPNEKVHKNIADAVQRYEISHAVVNDSDATLWKEMGIQCWPTIVVIGPTGQMLSQFIGEGHKEEICDFISATLDVFSDVIDHSNAVPILVGKSSKTSSIHYPSKVLVEKDELIISDTGNHRVLVCDLHGSIQTVIGSGKEGHADGSFTDCMFMSPQGMCKIGDIIYVSDSHSHCIRTIDLKMKEVITLVGTGQQGFDKVGGLAGSKQSISSPWDIKPYKSVNQLNEGSDGEEEDMLLIAMAGTHQIWAYFLQTVTWWKNRVYEAGTCAAIVGSGNEENRNNSYPMKSGLAQPSGLGVDASSNMCYIADSESSTIRQLSLKDGQVKGLAGGERDPMNLFAYGDVDGKGVESKLQHPLDVCCIPDSQYIIVCDSYNHKLKLVNTKTKNVTSLPLTGLNEPGGLSYHSSTRTLYIADTNNHSIKSVCLPTDLSSISVLNMEEVNIEISDVVDSPRKGLFDHGKSFVVKVTKDTMRLSASAKSFTVRHELPENSHITDEAESVYRATLINSTDTSFPVRSSTRILIPSEEDKTAVNMSIDLPKGSQVKAGAQLTLTVELLLYYCSNSSNLCQRLCSLITQQIHLTD